VNGKPIIFLKGISDLIIEDAGQVILYQCNRTTIQHVTVTNVWYAIRLTDCDQCCIQANTITGCVSCVFFEGCHSSDINDNLLLNNYYGITLISSPFCCIYGNTIRSPEITGEIGIGIASSFVKIYNNTVEYFYEGILVQRFKNIVKENSCRWNLWTGVHIEFGFCNTVLKNRLEHNGISSKILDGTAAVVVTYSALNFIKRNNFIMNSADAFFVNSLFTNWNGNYWNETRILPKMIIGFYSGSLLIPSVNFDWRPALKPYEILT
jgi:parallel beta-helix repeat protein